MGKVIGVYEIAERAGVTTGAVTNWIRRYADDFPKPVTELQAGKFYDSDQVEAWLRKRGKIMGAKVISFINLKGGVAKTTTTVGTATLLAGEFGKSSCCRFGSTDQLYNNANWGRKVERTG